MNAAQHDTGAQSTRSARFGRAAAVAVPFGIVAAALTFVSGRWALDQFGPQPPDGEFVLDTPGVFDEPTTSADDTPKNPNIVGQAFPAVELVDVDGSPIALSFDRPTIVNLWFSTCAPCARELPDFAAIDTEFGDRVDIVGVDPFDTVDAMTRFATDRGVTYPLLRDPDRTLTKSLGMVAFPVTLFIDDDGRIVGQLGEVNADDLRTNIAELFPETLNQAATESGDTERGDD